MANATLTLIAQFIIRNDSNILTSIGQKAFDRIEARRARLVEFMEDHEIQLIDLPTQVVFKSIGSELARLWWMGNVSLYRGFYSPNLGAEDVEGDVIYTPSKEMVSLASRRNFCENGIYSDLPSEKQLCDEVPPVSHGYASAEFCLTDRLISDLNKLSPAEMIEMLAIIFEDESHIEADPIKGELRIKQNNYSILMNFETGLVASRIERHMYEVVYLNEHAVTKKVAMFLLAFQLVGERNHPDELLNGIPNLFVKEANYGLERHPDAAQTVILKGARMSMGLKTCDSFPFLGVMNGAHQADLIERLGRIEGGALSDKTNTKTCYNALATLAMGIAFIAGLTDEETVIHTIHDGVGTAKELNRPNQARNFLSAHSVLLRGSGEEIGLSADGLEIIIPERLKEEANKIDVTDTIKTYGNRARILMTNMSSLLGMTSGVGFINPTTKFRVSVRKSATISLVPTELPQALQNYLTKGGGDLRNETYALISKRLDSVIDKGTVFTAGDEIFGMHIADVIDRSYLRWSKLNQPARVVGYELIKKGGKYADKTLTVKVELLVEVTDQFFKIRGDGKKFTTVPVVVHFYDEEGNPVYIDYDLILGQESLKGKAVALHGYANAHGGARLDVAAGTLEVNGETFSIMGEKNPVSEWVDANSRILWIEATMAAIDVEMLIEARGNHDDFKIVSTLLDNDGMPYAYVVRERVETLLVEDTVEVECSTPREASGRTGITFETLSALTARDEVLASKLFDENKGTRQAILSMAAMLKLPDPELEVPEIKLNDLSAYKALSGTFGASLRKLSDIKVIEALIRAFPKGLVLHAKSSNGESVCSMYMDFLALSLATFIGGSASEGISLEAVSLLRYILGGHYESGHDGTVYSKLKLVKMSINGWVSKGLDSAGIIKKLSRGAGAYGMKIRTWSHPLLNHRAGDLPKVMLNPNDDIVRQAKITDGTLVAFFRVPMTMIGIGEAVLSTDICEGHMGALGFVWAALNEGDSDGDGVALVNVSKLGLTREEALKINNGIMSFRGYTVAYGDKSNWPCAEFVSHKDKWGKKALRGGFKVINTTTAARTYAVAKSVNAHYWSAVPMSYNMAVVATHKMTILAALAASDSAYRNKYARAQVCCAIAWRLLYEGAGLSGYKPENKLIMDILWGASTHPAFVVWNKDNGLVRRIYKSGALELVNGEVTIDPVEELVVLLGLDKAMPMDIAKSAVNELINIRSIPVKWMMVEGGNIPKGSPEEYAYTILYGCLRRMSQGYDPNGDYESPEDLDPEATEPQSLFKLAKKVEVWNLLPEGWMREMFEENVISILKMFATVKRLNAAE